MKKLIDHAPIIMLIWSILFFILQAPNLLLFDLLFGTLVTILILLTMIIAFLGLPITWIILNKKEKLDLKRYKYMFFGLMIDMLLLNVLWEIIYFSGFNLDNFVINKNLLFACYGIGVIEILLRGIAIVSCLCAILSKYNKKSKEIALLIGISLFVTYLPIYAYSVISLFLNPDTPRDNIFIVTLQTLGVVIMFVLSMLCYKMNNIIVSIITGVLSSVNCVLLICLKITSTIGYIERIPDYLMGRSIFQLGDILRYIFSSDLLYIIILAFISIGAVIDIRNKKNLKNSSIT